MEPSDPWPVRSWCWPRMPPQATSIGPLRTLVLLFVCILYAMALAGPGSGDQVGVVDQQQVNRHCGHPLPVARRMQLLTYFGYAGGILGRRSFSLHHRSPCRCAHTVPADSGASSAAAAMTASCLAVLACSQLAVLHPRRCPGPHSTQAAKDSVDSSWPSRG